MLILAALHGQQMDFVAVLFILLPRSVRTALQAAVAYAVVHQVRLALRPQVVPMLIQTAQHGLAMVSVAALIITQQ
uniref:Uncharacterized protein n=1 Tax=Acrobeloides nanus TaxID=290746 RepID=A0A914DH46_9BILA